MCTAKTKPSGGKTRRIEWCDRGHTSRRGLGWSKVLRPCLSSRSHPRTHSTHLACLTASRARISTPTPVLYILCARAHPRLCPLNTHTPGGALARRRCAATCSATPGCRCFDFGDGEAGCRGVNQVKLKPSSNRLTAYVNSSAPHPPPGPPSPGPPPPSGTLKVGPRSYVEGGCVCTGCVDRSGGLTAHLAPRDGQSPRAVLQSLTCLTLSGLDCDMSGLGAGGVGQSTTCCWPGSQARAGLKSGFDSRLQPALRVAQ